MKPNEFTRTGLLCLALVLLIAGVGYVVSRPGTQPPTLGAKHCPTLATDCVPVCGDALGSCKVDAKDRWPISAACGYLKKHPENEHSLYAYWQTVHCQSLGGILVGGLTDDHCRATRGLFSGAPNLRSVFGAESLGMAAHKCSAATGIPVGLLSATDDPQTKEWPGGFQFCGDYKQWSTYYPDIEEGKPQKAALACIHWSL